MTEDESLQRAIYEPIDLWPYDPTWPMRYADERDRLAGVEPELAAVEHVGSTAVAGLSGKPIIDLMAAVPTLGNADLHVERLCGFGYVTNAEFNRTLGNRRWLMRHADGRRTHHLHLVLTGGQAWHDTIDFRDALRNDPDARAAYAHLKQRLAVEHAADRDAYTAAKTTFVRTTLIDWRQRDRQ